MVFVALFNAGHSMMILWNTDTLMLPRYTKIVHFIYLWNREQRHIAFYGGGKNEDEISSFSCSISGLDLKSSQRKFGLEFLSNLALLQMYAALIKKIKEGNPRFLLLPKKRMLELAAPPEKSTPRSHQELPSFLQQAMHSTVVFFLSPWLHPTDL